MIRHVNKNDQVNSWINKELAGCRFADVRLEKRFKALVNHMSESFGESIPMACQDWAATKAAYRFFSNERVSEAEILSGHFQATRDRFRATQGVALVLHDTTEFSFQRKNKKAIGVVRKTRGGQRKEYMPKAKTVCGMLLHSSLVITTEGLPLGISAVKFWTRKRFKGCNALKKKINPTRVPIEKKESMRWIENIKASTTLMNEPDRCVHIGDRESDIYELFCTAQNIGTHFLVRTCVNRLAGDGKHTIADEMKKVRVKGTHRIEVQDRKGNRSKAILDIRYRRIQVLPPIGKQNRYPEIKLTVLYAQERGTPKDREKINWKLITDLPVTSQAEAIEKLQWYASRWKIETFHKILKSGCKAEDSKLRTAERLCRLIAVFCLLSWRIFWMTMINRTAATLPASVVFTTSECQLLDLLVRDCKRHGMTKATLSDYITKVAKLGGYLARANDPPPGNLVMWRGLSRFTDIQLGFDIQMGNTCG
ncbi:MAG: IS4 family transposase [Candidatus Eisenbacteria bacterium]|uniref:IS4 family transposase n=1 Tax=Eiseniibacteriota bacterium TaxID=2212470 RepID=A0A948RSE3_UNCEI|nr:IS4 family transposase [Candidatus Eisenbacteria bacterium]MBU1947942.1 IS4 family transposase [Candidatus Eisenbacteria bacterium]MBU2690125.1 IS4 family transposase [Candidatus Eisenbacteria bacterium]